ncbi:PQQ-binding-like beta-propeller repeat protein [Paenibacillus sp. J2TS4]|uniref:S-layer homology domain-containing protein n=1 Tax=Paenibacillus sp. J2TS4 TaxID=2807194 RepID=UPI001B0499ED|nr:PQQ-binding-like beta-propeller repeat protein [Paenibacillus sp. J2TS4]GIP32541.1 hypothetical protein J2TS4_17510 [Paenibacillus sp. J2TS4]
MHSKKRNIMAIFLTAAITLSVLPPALAAAEPPSDFNGAELDLNKGLDFKLNDIIKYIPIAQGYPKGKVRWERKLNGTVSAGPVIGTGGTIYLGTENKKLYAIEADGTVKWEIGLSDSPNRLAVGPEEMIYVAADPNISNEIYAFDASGNKLWEFTRGGPEVKIYFDSPYSSPAIDANGVVIIGGANERKLYAIESDGVKKWEIATGGVPGSPGIGKDGTVYVGDTNGVLYAFTPKGARKWTFSVDRTIYGAPAVAADGTIYATSYRHGLYALAPDGSLKWSFEGYSFPRTSPAVGADGAVYIGTAAELLAFNPDGTVKWRLNTGDTVRTNPLIGADGTIYAGTDKALYAVGADGNVKWEFAASGIGRTNHVIGTDGTVYAASYSSLHALGTVAASSISLNKSMLNLQEGSGDKVTATVNPEEATNKRVKWESSDNSVAAVDSMGNVIGVAPGTAKITAIAEDGGFIAECVVTVTPAPRPAPLPTPVPALPFSDIEEHWAQANIVKAAGLYIANGYPDGTFRPDGDITRAEFCVLLMNGMKPEAEGAGLTFADRNHIGEWAVKAVSQAVQLGIVNGYPDGTFQPDANITHAEMIAMVVRASGQAAEEQEQTGFADDADIPAWAKAAAALARQSGIADFMRNNRMEPNAKSTRAEAVTAILNMLDKK